MKSLILALSIALLCHSFCFADALDDYLSKMTKVIDAHNSSYFCVASVPKGEKRTNQMLWPKTAVCVGDLIFSARSLQERRGCTAFIFNANNSYTYPLLQNYDYNMAVNKNCPDNGFEAVLNDLLYTNNTAGLDKPGKKIPVSAAFTSPYRLPDKDFDLVIVYEEKTKMERLLGKESKYKLWWKKAREEYLAELNGKKKSRSTASEENQ